MTKAIAKIGILKSGDQMRVAFDYYFGNAVRFVCADGIRIYKNGSWTELIKHPITGEYRTTWIDKEPVKITEDYSKINETVVKGDGFIAYYWTIKTL